MQKGEKAFMTVALSHTLISSGELEKVERKSSNVYSYFETLEFL